MKKSIIYGLLAIAATSLTGCNDFLNDNRWPLDTQSDNPEFWNSEVNVQGQINNLYNYFYGYGNGAGRNGTFYFESLSDDQVGQWGSSVEFNTWAYLITPSSNSDWNGDYDRLRAANYIINNVEKNTMAKPTANSFIGEAKIVRAYQLFDLVRKFGDVPLVLTVLDPSDPELYMGRTPRNEVIDQAVADLDFAIQNITTVANKGTFSQDLARAMKVEVCLFEASYAKYHANDKARSDKYFNEVIKTAGELMKSTYTLCDDYASLYNSTDGVVNGIPSLRSNPEVIFMKAYKDGVFCHSLVKYTNTGEILGMSRDAFESYLFLDGKPMSQQADKLDKGEMPVIGKDDDGKPVYGQLNIKKCLEARDKRLSATIDTVVFYENYGWARPVNGTSMTSKSGYGVKKFYNDKFSLYNATTDNQSLTCAPLYWLAEIYLAYAEAKAELGTITDTDLNLTINKLFKRAGLPEQTVAGLSAINDPKAAEMGVSSLIYEIRRCRRCELMFDKGLRYWDLVRWHKLDLLDNVKHPNVTLGAYAQPAIDKGHFVKNSNGYVNVFEGLTRVFTDREYLYPIGTNELTTNPALGNNNPGWEK